MIATTYLDRPCAAAGLTSYRYHGDYGFIMIGATDHDDALREAGRSLTNNHHQPSMDRLEMWNGTAYGPVVNTP